MKQSKVCGFCAAQAGFSHFDLLSKDRYFRAQVYCEGNNVWDAMLNQTNLQFNNNKYYLLQLLQETRTKKFYVWLRWGRVGKSGQNNLIECGLNLDEAKEIFTKKFFDKTKNEWANRKKFSKVAGKYDLLQMDYTVKEKEDEVDAGPPKKKIKLESKLDKRVQSLIELICNIQTMEDAVKEMKYDTKKAPLGKLTKQQIKLGYKALKQIESCLNGKTAGSKLLQACNDFYTRIPHDFGMRQPPVIRTHEELKAKLKLLEALDDIEVAMTLLKEKTDSHQHPVDKQYQALKCQLEPVEHTHPHYKIVEQYLQNTHAKTHGHYTMAVQDIFAVQRAGESESFNDVGNRMLLWHGSRLTNWMGILSQGLRIAPPEAPVTGYMFGKGVYFADMSSKSANYCYPTTKNHTGLVLLSEVALGNTNDLLAADYQADKLPTGKHSVWGKGKMAPHPDSYHVMEDGVIVPLGKGTDTGVTNPNGYTLNYNEYVVYDVSQIKMRYLVKVKFNFKMQM
ncbi:Poly [ADP-ribose] polymerase 2 [Branchiostoma belcheri]|nr:Poly [ADP-ribose] polymerase 2 [Branchiostoma belcheri]